MNAKKFAVVASLIFTLTSALGTAQQTQDQGNKTPYPKMAPLEQYLMDRDAEIALARSAAPESISRDATVVVLGRHGYETAVEGKNGFVCNVDRSWMDQFEKSPEFWNPKRRGPVCYSPPAARTVLPITLMRTKLALAGKSKARLVIVSEAPRDHCQRARLRELLPASPRIRGRRKQVFRETLFDDAEPQRSNSGI